MNAIILKDSLDADQTFAYKGTTQTGQAVFERRSSQLLGRAQITLNMNGNANVLRAKGKLSVPVVCEEADTCGVPSVNYIEVGSFDITVPTISSAVSRDDFIAMFSSLISSQVVTDMATEGVLPTA